MEFLFFTALFLFPLICIHLTTFVFIFSFRNVLSFSNIFLFYFLLFFSPGKSAHRSLPVFRSIIFIKEIPVPPVSPTIYYLIQEGI